MAEILKDLEQLSTRSDEVDIRKEANDFRDKIVELKSIIRENNLIALAAPQIGYFKRIFCINFKGDIKTFINPIITNVKGLTVDREKCDSIPGKEFLRVRHPSIDVVYQTPLGKIMSQKLVGLAAFTFQEQLDHLDGLLLSDVGLELDENWDKATEEEKDQILGMYLDSLDIKRKIVDKEISESKELTQIKEAADFMEKVQKGEVKLSSMEIEIDKK